MRILLILAVVALMGCASTGVVPMDKDTYIVSKRDAQVGFGPPVAAKADVYREANEFCAEQKKKVECSVGCNSVIFYLSDTNGR